MRLLKTERVALVCVMCSGASTCCTRRVMCWRLYRSRTVSLYYLKSACMLPEPVRCLVVEDEADAALLLRRYITQTVQLEFAALCRDTVTAETLLREQRIDLVFLDINLPGRSGVEWKRALVADVPVIFTTADAAFAAEGFELDAVDYLLKPFSYERFLQGLDRYRRLQAGYSASRPVAPIASERPFLMVRVERMLQKIYLDEVLYIEAKRNYLLVYLNTGAVKVYQPIKSIEERLPQTFFLRIHRSFIVATQRVRAFSSTIVHVDDYRLPVGRSYQSSVQVVLSR
ncbi:MAG: response regulator transcription factor [Chitinophagaceae bacterium]|nr:MAG: response regulator transcription factor [Chitinophagaceae bacterium]